MKYLDLDLIENPYGKRIGGGYETVLAGGGDRSHIKGDNGKPLCMQKVNARDVRPSSARTVTCYRCIKIMGMNSNAPFVTRSLTTSRGEKKPHLMMPGGRQGRMVADKKVSPYGETGAAPFKRGPANHPTQPWMTTRVVRAKTREERLREEGIALPVEYTPFSFAESVPAPALYASPAALKKRGAKGIMAAAAKVQALGEIRANPKAAAASMGGLAMYVHTSGQAPSLRAAWAMLGKQTPGLTDRFGDEIQYTQDSRTGKVGWYSEQAEHFKQMSAGNYNNPRRLPSSAQSEAALAMYVHTSGQAPSLKRAWAMLRRQTPGLTDRSGDEIVYHVDQRTGKVGFYSEQAEHEALMGAGHYNPRHRNPGQAAEAMNLFHSGQASSLAEAWDIVRGGAARPRKRTLMERAVYRPRTGAANAQNAAKAMKLFHSGQASSLAEAWQMVKGQRTNPYRRFR